MKKFNIILALFVAIVAMTVTSCKENPYKYEIAKGHPEVLYARMSAPADSLITGAYMGNFVCLVGNNLKSTVKVDFNDKNTYINTSLVTENTMLVQVPSEIPDEVSNKIFLTGEDGTVVEFPFNVLVPGPVIVSINNEFAGPGSEATIYGDYFLDASIDPFTLTLPDGTVLGADDVKLSKTAITFTVPANYTGEMGTINVHTVYGNCVSPFIFHDTRNVILDFDEAGTPGDHGGYAGGNGWRGSLSRCDGAEVVPALDGNFLWLGGNMDENGGWADDPFEFDAWYGDNYNIAALPNMAAMLDAYEIADLTMKFELFVPADNAWQAGAIQMIWMGEVNGNTPHSTATYPRGIFNGWAATGSYSTADWTTISMPLKDFAYGPNGEAGADAMTKDMFKGLSIFVFQGGVTGTACHPHFAIDNVRVVPN